MSNIVTGKIIKGYGYGKKLGFPTINIETGAQELPKEGVYTGGVTLEGKEYGAGIVVGPGSKVEAHLLGYADDAYGKEATIMIDKFIREYKKFDTEEELIKQINSDINNVKEL